MLWLFIVAVVILNPIHTHPILEFQSIVRKHGQCHNETYKESACALLYTKNASSFHSCRFCCHQISRCLLSSKKTGPEESCLTCVLHTIFLLGTVVQTGGNHTDRFWHEFCSRNWAEYDGQQTRKFPPVNTT